MSNTLLKNRVLNQEVANGLGEYTFPYQMYKFTWDTDITLPASLKYISGRNSINEISQSASSYRPTLTCDSNLKVIGDNSFKAGAYGNIILNNGLEYLGEGVCSNITGIVISSFNIPDSVLYVGKACFYRSNIQSISWTSNCKVIQTETFRNCADLTSITNLDNVRVIFTSVFTLCTKLSSIYLPSIEWLDNYAFQSCTSLATVTLGPNLGLCSSIAFQGCTALTTINVIGDENCITAQTLQALDPSAYNNATIVYNYTPPTD